MVILFLCLGPTPTKPWPAPRHRPAGVLAATVSTFPLDFARGNLAVGISADFTNPRPRVAHERGGRL